MSNIFTYEIDERNLRIQLKSMEIPLKEDAWQKFEAFSEANPFQQPKGRFKGFEINLNRNVVLPAVFGVIIMLFSFLLFNFITIKNPPVERAEKDAGKIETLATASKSQVTVASPISAPLKNSEIVKNTSEEKNISNEKIVKSETILLPAAPVVNEPVTVDPQTEQELEAARIEQILRQKRRKKAEEEALSAIKPTVVSDEDEPAVIPN